MKCHLRDVSGNGLPNRQSWTRDDCGPKSDYVVDQGRWPGPYINLPLPSISRNLLAYKKNCYLLLSLPHSFLLGPWFLNMQYFSSVQFSHSVVSNSLQLHGLQHTRPPCPSLIPGVCSNSCPLSQWCHPIISSSVVPFSSCLQSFPPSGSFSMSQFFTACGQSIGVLASTSIHSMNIQDWFPLRLTSVISLQSNGHSRVFSNTTV